MQYFCRMNISELCDKLCKFREESGMTKTCYAKKFGVQVQFVTRIEKGTSVSFDKMLEYLTNLQRRMLVDYDGEVYVIGDYSAFLKFLGDAVKKESAPKIANFIGGGSGRIYGILREEGKVTVKTVLAILEGLDCVITFESITDEKEKDELLLSQLMAKAKVLRHELNQADKQIRLLRIKLKKN